MKSRLDIRWPGRESTLIRNTLLKDPTDPRKLAPEDWKRNGITLGAPESEAGEQLALKQIYGLLRPGDAPNKETAKQALERLFFSPKRYDLGRVGRYKINQRLNLATASDVTVLTKEDFDSFKRYSYISRTSLGERTGEVLVNEALKFINDSPRPTPLESK